MLVDFFQGADRHAGFLFVTPEEADVLLRPVEVEPRDRGVGNRRRSGGLVVLREAGRAERVMRTLDYVSAPDYSTTKWL